MDNILLVKAQFADAPSRSPARHRGLWTSGTPTIPAVLAQNPDVTFGLHVNRKPEKWQHYYRLLGRNALTA